jgi:hypothetical protein
MSDYEPEHEPLCWVTDCLPDGCPRCVAVAEGYAAGRRDGYDQGIEQGQRDERERADREMRVIIDKAFADPNTTMVDVTVVDALWNVVRTAL